MRSPAVSLLLAAGLLAAGCATKRPLPPPALGTPGDAAAGSESDISEGQDAALSQLQRDLSVSAGSDRVLFALDAYELSPTAREILTRQAEWLRAHPDVTFSIEGHCDERGTREYNLALGERRAKSAADFLIALGIAPSRLRTISYGKERPEALGSDDESYAQNRRAVSIVVRSS